MLKAFSHMVNQTLGLVGHELSRRGERSQLLSENQRILGKYKEVINEVHACFCDLIFPDLPQCDRRTQLLAKLVGTPVSEAMYIVGYLHKALSVDGDVCEFGVAQGATSALLANEIQNTQRNLWLFDSFSGLPKPTIKDSLINDIFDLGSIDKYEGTMACDASQVRNRLREIDFPISRTNIVPGFIEQTINESNLPQRICFAYIDFDFYQPILTALTFLSERLSGGGFVVVDDYGFFSSGAKTAVDEFVRDHSDSCEFIVPEKFASVSTPFCIIKKSDQESS